MRVAVEDCYCLINVGRAVGKLKFCMLDETHEDISKRYSLRAVLLKGSATRAPAVHVLALPKKEADSDDGQVKTIQEIIWKLSHPESEPTFDSLIHINGNSMDNREANLALVDSEETIPIFRQEAKNMAEAANQDCSFYISCARQLTSLTTWVNVPECIGSIAGTAGSPLPPPANLGDYARLLDSTNSTQTIHECHYLPCTNLESKRLEYDSCGGCRAVRYCSSECQLLDWPFHSQQCYLVQHLTHQQGRSSAIRELSSLLKGDNSQYYSSLQPQSGYAPSYTHSGASTDCTFHLDR